MQKNCWSRYNFVGGFSLYRKIVDLDTNICRFLRSDSIFFVHRPILRKMQVSGRLIFVHRENFENIFSLTTKFLCIDTPRVVVQ